jgi:hypothetical protein
MRCAAPCFARPAPDANFQFIIPALPRVLPHLLVWQYSCRHSLHAASSVNGEGILRPQFLILFGNGSPEHDSRLRHDHPSRTGLTNRAIRMDNSGGCFYSEMAQTIPLWNHGKNGRNLRSNQVSVDVHVRAGGHG